MKLFFVVLLISCSTIAQNFEVNIHELSEKSYERTLTLKEIDSIISICPDIAKYPQLLFYKSRIYDDKDNIPLAINTLLEAKRYVAEDTLAFYVLTNLGIDYQLTRDYKNARTTFNDLIKVSEKLNDTVELDAAREKLLYLNLEAELPNAPEAYESYLLNKDYGDDYCSKLYTLTLIAENYNIKKQYRKATNLFRKVNVDVPRLDVQDCSCSIQLYYELKAEIALYNKAYTKTIKTLDSIPYDKIKYPCEKVVTYKHYKNAHEQLGNKELALLYNDTIVAILDESLQEIKDSNAVNVTKNEENRLQASRKISTLSVLIIALASALLIIALLLIYSKRARLKLQSSLHFYKDKYNDLWTNYQLSNKQLEKLKEELIRQTQETNEDGKELNNLLKDLSIHLSTNKDDEHKHINVLKENFINSLQREAPFLNNQEQLICFFLNLNIPQRKIGELLNRTEKSIESYKYRINTKVKRHQNTTIDELIESLKIK